MYNTANVVAALKAVIGWRNHHSADIADLPVALNVTESGEYFQDYHPLANLTNVNAIKPEDQSLDDYLTKLTEGAIIKMMNNVILQKREIKATKDVLSDGELIDKLGWTAVPIIPESRFVGFEIQLRNDIGITAAIKRIAMQMDIDQILKIYLFHSSQEDSILDFDIETTKSPSVQWFDQVININARSADYVGGVYYLGYYEDDLAGQAINRSGYNWLSGSCTQCGSSAARKVSWSKINNSIKILPIEVQNAGVQGKIFESSEVRVSFEHTWGLNLSLGIKCDFTQFMIDNRMGLKNLIGLSVIHALIMDAKYSNNLNFIKQNADYQIVQELGGVKDSNYISIVDQLQIEFKAVRYDHTNLSTLCLNKDNRYSPRYSQA